MSLPEPTRVVVVIEHDDDTRAVLVDALTAAGFLARGLSTPELAVQLLKQVRVDVVILDPNIVADLRAFIDEQRPRFIAVTGDREQHVDPGWFDAVVTRPFAVDAVTDTVRSVPGPPRRSRRDEA
jgi:DNA-binding response OmpR family regulator